MILHVFRKIIWTRGPKIVEKMPSSQYRYEDFRGQKKHINFFNTNFLAELFGPPEKSSCASFPGKGRKKGTHINFSGGFLGQKGCPKRPVSATKSLVYCVFFLLLWETDFLPLLVLTRQRRSTDKNPNLVLIFLENTREFPEMITSTGAKFKLRFCLSVLVLVIFLVSDLRFNVPGLVLLLRSHPPFARVLRGPSRKVPPGVLFECFWAQASE